MLEWVCNSFFLGFLFITIGLLYLLRVVIRKTTKFCLIQGRLVGRLAVITGANRGIGLETAIDLARRGATVILACRDVSLANVAKREILDQYGQQGNKTAASNAGTASPEVQSYYASVKADQFISSDHITEIDLKVRFHEVVSGLRCSSGSFRLGLFPRLNAKLIVEQIDLSSLESVMRFAERVSAKHPKIDYLINNAGIYMQPFGRTREGFEMNLGVNYLGHFLLTLLLLPSIKRAGAQAGARIVNVSSLAHRFGKVPDLFPENPEKESESYWRFQAYANSKLAQVIHARELARRLQGTGVCAVSLHPGTCATNIVRIPIIRNIVNSVGGLFLKTAREGAQTTIYTLMSPRIQNGGYYSDCDLAESNPLADDDVIAKKLWKSSEQAVDPFIKKLVQYPSN